MTSRQKMLGFGLIVVFVLVNFLDSSMREGHIERLNEGICGVDSGLVFIDMLTNFEKIGDLCFNIAEAVVGIK